MKALIFTIAVCVVLAGCESDEQQCLNSERLNFKDPEVLFVANLGSRGMKAEEGKYWVRYKAKNSYGAYLQGNMLCMKNEHGKWVRDKFGELLATMDVQIGLLARVNEDMEQHVGETHYPKDIDGYIEKQAREIVYTLPDSLAEYHRDGAKKQP